MSDTIDNKDQSAQKANIPARLGIVSFFNDASSEIIGKILPLFLVSAFGATPTFIGFIEGLADTANIFLNMFFGWLSDRTSSRKPFIVFGYTLSFFSRFMMLLNTSMGVIGTGRVLDRVGKGIRTAPRDAFLADATPKHRAGYSFGINRLLDTLGGVMGMSLLLMLGFGDQELNQQTFSKFLYISVPFGFAAVIFLIFFVPTFRHAVSKQKKFSFRVQKNVKLYLAIVFVFALAGSSDAFLILRAKELGMSLSQIITMLIAYNVVAGFFSLYVGKLSDTHGRLVFLFSGWLLYAMTYFFMANFENAQIFAITFLLYGLFYGFTEGVEKAFLYDLLPPDQRGVGYGSLQVVLGAAALPASLATGLLMSKYGTQVALNTCAGIALFAVILLLVFGKKITGTFIPDQNDDARP